MRIFMIVSLFLLSAMLSSMVYAHKVNMFVYQEAGQVFVEGYFADGRKSQKSEVVVYDEQDKLLLSGQTDDKGVFAFIPTHKGALRITLDAGLGHKTEYELKADEWEEVNNSVPAISTSAASELVQTQAVTSEKSEVVTHSAAVGFDEKALQIMINKAVHEANTPLIRSLEDAQKKASMSDIIGGIGFIFGILGVILYFQARKQ
ncbi:MAG: hypothetical protein L3J70_04355 [Gammaproteobacteria bacterium]|nr:hypothetical protein [Gammaproteobacteria bacterium]